MYFLKKDIHISRSTLLYHILPATMVLIVLLSLSTWVWFNAKETLDTEIKASVDTRVGDIEEAIESRLNSYKVILQGGASLFMSSQEVTESEWKRFVDTFELSEAYPGVQGVGYSVFIQPERLDQYIETMQEEVNEDFTIHPEGDRDLYTAIQYLEPQDRPNQEAIGYDMYSNPIRREAMTRAAETSSAAMTAKVDLIQNDTDDIGSGFLMYVPIYTQSTFRSNDVPQRLIRGFSYAPFISEDFFSEIYEREHEQRRQYRIYDSAVSEENLLFETPDYDLLSDVDSRYTYRQEIEAYGRTWIVDYRFSPEVVAETLRRRPLTSFISSIIVSLILSGFVYALLVSRTRALAAREEQQVRNAKDELLSLASHQLRTPATGVKQYLGMLKDGFAGPLNKDQTELLERADTSNERQLNIINELLYVAKIDAEGIVLSKRRLNISSLVSDVVNELSSTIDEGKHTLKVKIPKKLIWANADEQCMRMALENLISNAIKYSPDKSTIVVRLKLTRGCVSISVKDEGIGIAADEIPLLFKRFSRIPNELSQNTSGSGIGLYLSKRLVELHGGDIYVDSDKGKGSTFTIEFPQKLK